MVRCEKGPCGRLPEGLRTPSEAQPSLIAAELAAAAHLEGAAVFAFQALERELIAHRAPLELLHRARSAQKDERRHHAAMSLLAHRAGANVPPVRVVGPEVRTLLEIARENAVEGCVRETYGAAVAAFQGEWAGDPALRQSLRSIAVDEAEHASLGWAVDAWARSRLPAAQRTLVDDDRARAVASLRAQAAQPVARQLCATLGMPDAAAALRMTEALAPLWAA